MKVLIDEEIRDALESVDYPADDELVITETLERSTYVKVAKVLKAMGAKWETKGKVHRFPDGEAKDHVDAALSVGFAIDEFKRLNFFPTPATLAEEMVRAAKLNGDERVLEPSAGKGAIASALMGIYPRVELSVCEINAPFHEDLSTLPLNIIAEDFLQHDFGEQQFDAIIANPPFAPNQADHAHVSKMFDLLAPGGTLVAVMAAGYRFRDATSSKTRELRKKLTDGSYSYKCDYLPDGTFKSSGTDVRTVLLVLKKKK